MSEAKEQDVDGSMIPEQVVSEARRIIDQRLRESRQRVEQRVIDVDLVQELTGQISSMLSANPDFKVDPSSQGFVALTNLRANLDFIL